MVGLPQNGDDANSHFRTLISIASGLLSRPPTRASAGLVLRTAEKNSTTVVRFTHVRRFLA